MTLTAGERAPCPRWERWGVVIFLLGFLLLSLVTATRYPFVWNDEVMYADPAVNLYLGHGFTSSAWYAQNADEFWAGNVPLHSVLLYFWLKLFGFSILAVRSINFFYFMTAGLLLWRASIRLSLLRTSWARLLLFALMATGYSMIFSYRSGRPDFVALLLVSASIYVYSRGDGWQWIFGLFGLGCLMPWAGLQLLPLVAVAGVLLPLWVGRRILRAVLAMWTGVAAGVVSLYWFYASHGVWGRFLASIRQHTTIGFFGWLTHGELRHSNLVPKDFSFMLLALPVALLAIQSLRTGNKRSAITFGPVYSAALTLALLVSGKFPTYYGWMTYLPLALCLCITLEQLRPAGVLRWICWGFLAAAMLVGAGLHIASAAYDWQDRDYGNVEKLVRDNVSETDWMYGEFSTYYAGKRVAARAFMPLYLTEFRESEKEQLTVLVIAPNNFNEVTNAIGGSWATTGKKFVPQRSGFLGTRRNMGFLSMQNYHLEVYRRTR